MALLGEGARGVPIDYSQWAESAWRLGAANAGAFNSVAGAVTDVLEDRKVKKDQIKVSSDLLKAYATINPERADTFTQIAEQLKDEERPLSERAALGEQIGALIGMDQDRQKSDRQIAQFAQNYALDLQRANLTEDAGRFELGAAKEDRDLAKQSLAEQEEVRGMIAPNLLLNVLERTKAMEDAGQQVMFPSSQLQQALQTGTPQQKLAMAQAAMSNFPDDGPTEFRDIPITMNGQPGTATAPILKRQARSTALIRSFSPRSRCTRQAKAPLRPFSKRRMPWESLTGKGQSPNPAFQPPSITWRDCSAPPPVATKTPTPSRKLLTFTRRPMLKMIRRA
jgi:hypothetical protein